MCPGGRGPPMHSGGDVLTHTAVEDHGNGEVVGGECVACGIGERCVGNGKPALGG